MGQPRTAHQPRELVGVLSSAVTSNSADTQEPSTAADTFWWYLRTRHMEGTPGAHVVCTACYPKYCSRRWVLRMEFATA